MEWKTLVEQNSESLTPYEIQIICTIIAPTPLVAANFIILGRIVGLLGSQYSRLTPRLYTIIFCTADFVALIVQFSGGGMAAIAAGNNESPTLGGNIMLGGIIFQMVAITVYVACASEFFFRYFTNKPFHRHDGMQDNQSRDAQPAMDRNLKFMTSALMFSTLCLFIRSIYRTIELADGWNGTVIATQWLFNTFDGAMVVLAMYTFIFEHPGRLLPKSVLANHNNHTLQLHSAMSTTSTDLEVQGKTLSVAGSLV